jgi:DNA topoisomerase IB
MPAVPDWIEIAKRLTFTAGAGVLLGVNRSARGRPAGLRTTVDRLLETSFIRVGNDEYVWENDSFGLTTLRNRYVEVEGARQRFHFRGKSGLEQDCRQNKSRFPRRKPAA